jgi:hypothetical protein
VLALSLTAAACTSTSSATTQPAGATTQQTTVDTSQQTCDRFREVATGAFGESMSAAQVVDGLKEVGGLGTTATNPSISTAAVQVGEEANARALIAGNADPAMDALADACNEAFPI